MGLFGVYHIKTIPLLGHEPSATGLFNRAPDHSVNQAAYNPKVIENKSSKTRKRTTEYDESGDSRKQNTFSFIKFKIFGL